MDDGSEDEFGPGEVSLLPPGHDAWVVGAEPVSGNRCYWNGDLRKAGLHASNTPKFESPVIRQIARDVGA
jgi:hypothetical protein